MNQKNKKMPPLYDSEKKVMELALFYCSKRETSRPKLKLYLLRKLRLKTNFRSNSDEPAPLALQWIESILNKFETLKIIDHERYADLLTREYTRRGKGTRYVQQKLKEKGVAEEGKKIEFSLDDEFKRAKNWAKKVRNKSTIQKITDPYLKKQKLLQNLVAHGFEFGLAKKAIHSIYNEDEKDED